MYNILVIASYDSFLKSAINIAERINHDKIDVGLLQTSRNNISQRQLNEARADKYTCFKYCIGGNINHLQYDIIILSVGNIASRKIIHSFKEYQKNKFPFLISIFPGVIWGNVESLLSRINSDLLLVNSKKDEAIAKKLTQLYSTQTQIINYGLINVKEEFIHTQKNDIHNIYFIDQVKIPFQKQERLIILERLLDLAIALPSKNIYLKSRIDLSEKTVHCSQNDYKLLIKYFHNIPNNFHFITESMVDSFQKMDLCISISSSVILEALFYGIPSCVISDLGIKREYASEAFILSNLFVSFDDIKKLEIPTVNSIWYKENISFIKERDFKLNTTIQTQLSLRKPLNFLNANRLFGGTNFDLIQNGKNKSLRKVRKLFKNPYLFFFDMLKNKGII